MILYLVRHGSAEDASARGDRARELTADGRAKMRAAARGLLRLKLAPAVLFTSPLVRARQTADILHAALAEQHPRTPPVTVTDTLSPPGDLDSFLALLRRTPALSADTSAVAVAHEPFLSQWIGQLCFGRSGRCVLKKGGVAAVELPAQNAAACLLWLLQPRHLRALGR